MSTSFIDFTTRDDRPASYQLFVVLDILTERLICNDITRRHNSIKWLKSLGPNTSTALVFRNSPHS